MVIPIVGQVPMVLLEIQEILTGLRDAGTYSLIITSGGCVSESYDFIINPLSPLVVNFNVIGNINCIEDTAEIQAQVQGGAGNYLYSWNTGLTTKSIIAERGTYTLTVRDELNNEVTETFTLNLINSSNGAIINEPLSVVVASTNNIVCYGTNTGIIELTIEGGADPYQVFWDGSFTASSDIRTDFSAGDHYYTVIDSNGCEVTNITTPINIIQPANAFTVSGSGTDATSNGGNEGTLTIILANGEAPYNYIWTKDGQIFTPPVGSTDTDLINLETGNYQVIATDAIGCEASLANPIFIDQPGPLSIGTPEAIINPVQCFGASDGRITANYTGTAPFNFTWFNEANQPLKNGTEDFIDNLDPGNYYYIINDNSTALPIQSNVLSIPIVEPLNAEFTITNTVSCNNGNDGSLTITNATGGNGNYQYQLNNGILQNSPIFENLVPGTYTLTLYDENCSFVISNNIVLDNPTLITLDSFQINPITAFEGTDGAITIEVSGGEGIYNYSWTGPGITGTRTTKDIDNLSTGNYVVEITTPGNQGGIDGCYLRQEFFVNEPGPLSITLNQQNNISCFGANDGSILSTIVGEAPIVYTWSETNTGVLTTTAEDDIENLPPGTYKLTVTDASTTPAVTSAEITITEPDALTGEVFPTDVSCADETDGSIIVNVIGGTPNFEYSLDNGANYQPNANISGLAAGNYTVRVRDANGCTIDLPFTINAPLALGAEIVSQSLSQASAADGAISLVAFGGTGNLTYAWTGPNGYTSNEENNLAGLVGGTYQLTLTDDNGCVFVSDAIEIAEPGELIVSISQTILLECNGDTFGEITANFQGGVLPYTFQWFDNSSGNEIALSEDTSILGDLPAGSYFIRITDGNGISRDSNEITITEPELLEIELISTTPVLCSGESTGAIDITVSGGTLPYTYSWDTGALTEDLNNIPADTYNILVTDANGCFTKLNVTVDAAPDAIQIANISVNNLSDYQSNDGSIALEITGGAIPYAISWIRNSDNVDFGSNTTINNLTADSYTISVTDNNGCSIFESYEVTQPDIVEETITPPTCTGESNGSILLFVNKGNGNFTYTWNTGETTNTINNLAAGSYTVTIVGFGEGPLTRTYILEDPLPLEVDLGEDRTLCVNQVLDLDATVADATATYNWTSDTGFSSSSPLVTLTNTGNYTVTIQTASGCTAEGSIFVDISTEEIDAEFAMSSQVFVDETLIVVDISFPLPDTLKWVLPENTTIRKQDKDEAEIVFNEPGEYDITIITSRGACIATKTKKVIVLAVDPTVNQDLALQSESKSVKDFLVYPNPNNGLFTVDVALPERGNISVKIFNFANNSMIAIERANGQSEYTIPFDISGLPTGVYAVVLETPNGSFLRKLVVR